MTVELDIVQTSGSALLESIERGDDVHLQKDGETVATVTPKGKVSQPSTRTPEQIAATLAAFEEIQKLSQQLNLGPFDLEEFKRDRDFGRR